MAGRVESFFLYFGFQPAWKQGSSTYTDWLLFYFWEALNGGVNFLFLYRFGGGFSNKSPESFEAGGVRFCLYYERGIFFSRLSKS